MTDQTLTFEAWIAEVRRLAALTGVPQVVDDAESWREQFDAGLSPDETWSNECYYAAADND